ncbi:Glutathione S-transferase [Sulfitobacter noctilucae]|uniref:glutathione S-transferase n=1 Tax=Sulfitobacter noctilucae TaxID=1342302 RepID=UPI00046829D4|nr:glutathione S-transferase [Sulfitobacter noctilucae]KIN75352.1 Glutathione S-transferase [Sulfitobacter noctilucae]
MSGSTGSLPTFYSFRRCPYAMRARLALDVSGVSVDLREVVLRDKPQAFLDASPSATVPCLVEDAQTIDESLDIMDWALARNDPEGWLDMPTLGRDLIARFDGPFKSALDRTKYATRYPDEDPEQHRTIASSFLTDLNTQLHGYIFGKPTLADYAILPFVRQFAMIDKEWFDAQDWPSVQDWLGTFLASDRFARIMLKYDPWQPENAPVRFPE